MFGVEVRGGREAQMWSFQNPVRITFGYGVLQQLATALAGRRYLLVTYDEPSFTALTEQITAEAGAPLAVIKDIKPNPDFADLDGLAPDLEPILQELEVVVALGGGSVIDAAKAIAAAPGEFSLITRHLQEGSDTAGFSFLPIIALPTTAGTGSEVTCWASVWDSQAGKKYSLAHPRLFPEQALVDPDLMVTMPGKLTISTGLDALSHALEAIWNRNANPLSTELAVSAATGILATLPALAKDLSARALRYEMAKSALIAGLAFSNTKTALAHSLSYPITLQHGLPHGLACSFSLPMIMASVIGQNPTTDQALKRIFGADLEAGVERFAALLTELGVSIYSKDYGIAREDFRELIAAAFDGERGRNFIGEEARVLAAEARLCAAPSQGRSL